MQTKSLYVEIPADLHHALITGAHAAYMNTGRRTTIREIVIQALARHLADEMKKDGEVR